MAAPVDAARATTDGSTSTTAQTLNLPGGISAGDLLIAVIRTPTSSGGISVSGFTAVSILRQADASDDDQQLFMRIADGSEGGTVNVTLGSAARMAGLCYRVTGGDTVSIADPAGSAGESLLNGTSATPNGPLYQPYATGHTHDTLWLSTGGIEGARTITTAPSSYSNATIIANTGTTGNGQCSVYGASREVTGDLSEDPGAWTLSASDDWMLWTVAVYTADPRGRVTQLPVEVAIDPTDQDARIYQAPVEVAIDPTDQDARIYQLPVEVAIEPVPQLRVTHLPVEAIAQPTDAMLRVTHIPVEVIVENIPVVAPTFQVVIID